MPPDRRPPDVLGLLPHRYPFLLLDRITHVETGRRACGITQVTGERAVPHTLVLEMLAQLSAAVLAGLIESPTGVVGYFLGVDRVRFRGDVRPGDTIDLDVALRQFKRGICRTQGIARIGGATIVRADLTTIVRPAE